MQPRLPKILARVSLLLCLAITGLWLRSYFVSEHIAKAVNNGPAWVVRSSGGVIYLDQRSFWQYQPGWTWGRRKVTPWDSDVEHEYQRLSNGLRWAGFGLFTGTAYTWPGHLYPDVTSLPNQTDPRWWRDNYRTLTFPHWVLVLLFGILPLRRYLRTRKERKRAAKGLCPTCGYDLRATNDRCPECGTPVAQSLASPT